MRTPGVMVGSRNARPACSLYVTGWVCKVVCDALPALQRAAMSACVKGEN
jgi:hypothetical protein